MTNNSIYQFVKYKLEKHGVSNTKDGLLTLADKKLFSLFVELERSKRASDFNKVQSITNDIESYLISINKRHLLLFAYMYLRFSEYSPKLSKLDEKMADGSIMKSMVFENDLSDEERLIGLWATVQYDRLSDGFFRILYSEKQL